MIKKLSLLTLTTGCVMLLWGADFWTAKPFTEWDQKEVQTLLTDSPWADRMSIETGQRGVISNADDGKQPIQGNVTVPVTAIWRTALPIKQAFAKAQNTVGTPETKASLEKQETNYVLQLVGLPGSVRAAAADKEKFMAETSIKIKGKPDMKPVEYQIVGGAAPGGPGGPGGGKGGGKGFGGPGGGTFDLLVVFPKTQFTADDKEIEFSTKLGSMVIRKKYKLKDMMFNGKLEM